MTEPVWEKFGIDKPDLIKVNEDGHEQWFYMLHMFGRDDSGVYELVLDGPAKGERVYHGK